MTKANRWPRKLGATLGVLLTLSVLAACADNAAGTPGVPNLGVLITAPTDGATVDSSTLTMSCEIGSAVTQASYSLNGGEPVPLTFTERRYSFEVEGLAQGDNTVVLTVDDDDPATAPVSASARYRYDGGRGDNEEPRSLIALDADNRLVRFSTDDPEDVDTVTVNGINGTLLGVDYRPANGLLYGLTDTNDLYTIDPMTGSATLVSTLNISFGGGSLSGVDFNPVADRLRVTGTNDQNFRINVDTGEVTLDAALTYAAGDKNAGADPSVTASAYRNSVAGATETALYDLDAKLDILALQNPPNDGALQTIGKLGVDFGEVAGFDIYTSSPDRDRTSNTAYAVSNSQLYEVSLTRGQARRLGKLPRGNYRGLAVMPEDAGETAGDDTPRDMVALGRSNTLVLFNSGNPEKTDERRVRGVRGRLLGIDYRPANGLLYGLSSSNRLYVIDAERGRAREVSRLNARFDSGSRSGLDFNPVVDRLRLTGTNDQNLRVNVDTGAAIVDGTLAYAAGDANAGRDPAITASAYRNAFAGATVTELYGIDAELDVLVEQNPPNDGALVTTGALGFDVAAEAGFDIVTDSPGDDASNVAYVLSGSDLYKVDLNSGAATRIGAVPGGSFSGLAIVPAAN